MPDGIDYKIAGLDEVAGKLRAVSEDLRYKGGRFALRKAAQLVQKSVQSRVRTLDDPITPESIADNIAVRFSPREFRVNKDIKFRVGVLGGARSTGKAAKKSARRRARQGIATVESLGQLSGAGKNNPGGDTFYWRFLDLGTKNVSALRFMQQSMQVSAPAAINEFVKQYGKALDRAIKRARKARV